MDSSSRRVNKIDRKWIILFFLPNHAQSQLQLWHLLQVILLNFLWFIFPRSRKVGESGTVGEYDDEDDDSYVIHEEDEVEVDDDVYRTGHGTLIHGVINGGMYNEEEGERMDLVMGHQHMNGRLLGGYEMDHAQVTRQSIRRQYASAYVYHLKFCNDSF